MAKKVFVLTILNVFFFACTSGYDSGPDLIADYQSMLTAETALDYSSRLNYMSLEKSRQKSEKISAATYDSMMKFKRMSSELRSYIRGLQSELISASENLDTKFADTLRFSLLKNPDGIDATEDVLFRQNKADELTKKIKEYESLAGTLFPEQNPGLYFNSANVIRDEYFSRQSLLRSLIVLENIKLQVLSLESLLSGNLANELEFQIEQSFRDSMMVQ